MGDKPFIKFYPSDFLAGTSGLSPAERGVYITLLCLIYEADGPVERDDARLSRRCGSPKAAFKRTLDALIDEGKIVETDGMLSNKRAEKAIVDRRNRSQTATHAAHQRWTAQSEKTQTNQRGEDARALPEQCRSDASQNQNQKPDIKRDTEVSLALSARESVPDLFSEFWDQYPHRNGAKKGKAAARKKWDAAIKARASPQQIIAGALRYANDRQVVQGYAKDPATWLNQKGWEDDVEPDSAPRRNTASNAGIREIAFAAAAVRSPRDDCF